MAAVTISAGVQSGGEGADDFALGIAERRWPAHQFVLEIDQARHRLGMSLEQIEHRGIFGQRSKQTHGPSPRQISSPRVRGPAMMA